MRLSDLQKKDVVNVTDGSKIGNIIDIKLDDNGNMAGFIVEKSKFIISMFTSSNEIEVKWSEIKKIGEDVILVSINN